MPARTMQSVTTLTSLLLVAGIGIEASPMVHQDEKALVLQESMANIAEKIAPCVVSIASLERVDGEATEVDDRAEGAWVIPTTDPRYPGYKRIGASTGFIIDAENGIILTARTPLLKDDGSLADAFDVETDDKLHSLATVIGAEPNLDLAFLRVVVGVDGRMPELTQVTWGDSAAMKPGYWAFAIGDPYGIEWFFDSSVLSAVPSRDCYQEDLAASYLQTALDLHPEAVGGPLVDIHGDVIGLLAARDESMVIGPVRGNLQYALPSKIIEGIAESILARNSFSSPWLGFSVMSREELREQLGPRAFSRIDRPPVGIWIENVFEPSPAHSAGLRPGDFLVSLDGHPINTPIDFQKHFYLAGVGEEVELGIHRDGATNTSLVVIEERPPAAGGR